MCRKNNLLYNGPGISFYISCLWVYLGREPFDSAHGLVRCKRAGVKACGEGVLFTDVKIKWPGMWMTSCTGSVCGGFWESWKSQRVEFCLGGRRLTFACSPKPGQWPCGRCRTCFGADGKASIERLCLSPYVEKPFNSKVLFTNPSARAGYDTRSIFFKRSLTGLNSDFPSPRLVASPRLKNLVRPTIYP